jgi:Flp pilus assembly protein TadG
VTVETALSLIAMVLVLVVVMWGLGVLAAELAVGEAARAGARSAARGDTPSAVADEARAVVAAAAVEVRQDGDHVVVTVRRQVQGPGVLSRLGTVDLSASATAALESAP